ncbi:MAG TPA: alpha/beta fold hydrolase [Terracidiphilus sp.]|nr:alpha/beta fold hydrolase [Terracidiphilus sp.]
MRYSQEHFTSGVRTAPMQKICHALCPFVLLFCALAVPASAQDATGDWIGQLNSGFKVRIHIDKTSSGFSGYLTNASGNRTDLDEVIFNGPHLHLAVTKLSLTYDGTWSAQEHAWNGTLHFQQDYALSLRPSTQADPGRAIHRRPQEEKIAAGLLPYEQRQVVFENALAHNRLAGTLSLPEGSGPFPAVVLVSGTGHNTRDEEVSGHEVFVVLADALSRRGFAVLRYDKRGVGGSTGNFDAATTEDFASDADAAVRWLCAQPMIDSRRVGILGHSEGGIIAPMVAVSDSKVAFVVMIAGPALRGDKLFVLQSAMTARAYGAPEDYIARRMIFDQTLYDAVIAAPSASAALESAQRIVAEGVAEKLVDENEAKTLAQDVTSAWERYFLAYDPAPALARLSVPVLAMYGSLDVQVPGMEDLVAASKALKSNANAVVVLLPGKNHLMQDATTGAPNEYNDIEETMSPAALGVIVDWATRFSAQ